MISYKDKTFCASEEETHTCNRVLSKSEHKRAETLGLPIAWAEFCTTKPTKE